MVYEVRGTCEFERDYDSVLDYLVNVLHSRSGAMHLLDEMDRAESLLKHNPWRQHRFVFAESNQI